MAYFDESGNEVKGLLTEDEVKEKMEAEQKTLVEEAATAKATADAAIAKAEEDKTALQAQIDAAAAAPAGGEGEQTQDDKDKNMAALRKKLDDKDEEVKVERDAMAARITALEGDKVEQAIAAVAADNTELAEKIRHNYDKTLSGVQATTAEEISAKVQNAVKLSTSAASPNPLDSAIPGAAPQGGTPPGNAASQSDYNANEKSVGGKLGVSDADREKYAERVSNMNTK